MSNSNKVVVVLLVLATLSYLVYFFMNSSRNQLNDDVNNNGSAKVINQEDFKLEYTYKGNNSWDYLLTGNMPTPCYTVEVNGLVRESYPEQVVISAKLVAPDGDVMCAQVITPFEKNGNVSASEGATFELTVE